MVLTLGNVDGLIDENSPGITFFNGLGLRSIKLDIIAFRISIVIIHAFNYIIVYII